MQTITPKEYLTRKGIAFRESGKEIITRCFFKDCDKDSRGTEAHLYFNAETGQYDCKKCLTQGNLFTLAKHFGDEMQEIALNPITPAKNSRKSTKFDAELVETCYLALPAKIREYLNARGISDAVIDAHKLGWGRFYNKWWITIPIQDVYGAFCYFKLRRDPNSVIDDMLKYITYPKGIEAQIYGWETLASNAERIVICEGEMDRLALLSKGIDAITSTHGAGTFKKNWAQTFSKMKSVYVCYDRNDKTGAGDKGAEKVLKILSQIEGLQLFKITLPDEVGKGGDITDYFIKLNGNADDLFGKYARKFVALEKEEGFKPLSFAELMAKAFKDTEWLVEQLVPAEGTTAMSGAPAAYKTWLILDLALKVANGDILFDKFVTNQGGVLVVDEENGERLLQKRLQKLCKCLELPIYFLSLKGFRLEKKIIEQIISFAKEKSVKLIIFDSLVRIHNSDENDATKMAGVFNLLKQFNIEKLTVIFTHHNRKQGILRSNPSQDMRGSSDILASVDCHLAIERKQKDDFLTITQTKLRQGEEIKPFKLSIINDENELRFEYAGEIDEVQTKKADMKEAIQDILGQENRPLFGKELFEGLKNAGVEGGYSTFKGALKEMIEKSSLFEKKGEKNKTFFSLVPFEPDGEVANVG